MTLPARYAVSFPWAMYRRIVRTLSWVRSAACSKVMYLRLWSEEVCGVVAIETLSVPQRLGTLNGPTELSAELAPSRSEGAHTDRSVLHPVIGHECTLSALLTLFQGHLVPFDRPI